METLRALVYSDLQAEDGNEFLRSDPTTPLQRWRVRRLYADLAQLFVKHKCQFLIDLGDTTESRTGIKWGAMSEVARGLWSINPDPALSLKLIGNHEQPMRNGLETPADAYLRHHFVIRDRAIICIDEEGPAIVCASYPANHADLTLWLENTTRTLAGKKILLLGHFQAIGAKMPSGFAENGIPAAALAPFTLGLLGHVHRPQSVAGTNCHYVGSPFQQNLGEQDEEKRVGLLDLRTLELKWLPLPSRYPAYRSMGVEEFEKCAAKMGEDRLTVSITNAKEAEQFRVHPLNAEARTSLEHYETPAAATPSANVPTSREGLMERQVEDNPLENWEKSDLLALGRELAG